MISRARFHPLRCRRTDIWIFYSRWDRCLLGTGIWVRLRWVQCRGRFMGRIALRIFGVRSHRSWSLSRCQGRCRSGVWRRLRSGVLRYQCSCLLERSWGIKGSILIWKTALPSWVHQGQIRRKREIDLSCASLKGPIAGDFGRVLQLRVIYGGIQAGACKEFRLLRS